MKIAEGEGGLRGRGRERRRSFFLKLAIFNVKTNL
jgi:hypothetical protein